MIPPEASQAPPTQGRALSGPAEPDPRPRSGGAPTSRPISFDVVALGEALVEFNQTTPGDDRYLRGFGGDTSNAVIAAARAGARCAYLTRLGSDEFGDSIDALLRAEHVDTAAIERDPQAPTGLYFVTHGATGHTFSYLRAGSAAARMSPGWLPREIIAQAGWLHVSGISMAISASACDTVFEAMHAARAAGTAVSFDSNLRLRLWPLDRARACIAQAVRLCDLFLPSLEDLTALTGEHDADRLADWAHGLGARTVVIKLGAQGCLVSTGAQRERITGHTVPMVDATGAGDCFCGNLLARLAAGDDITTAARWANAAAALAVQGWGAVAPLPRPEAVRALLAG